MVLAPGAVLSINFSRPGAPPLSTVILYTVEIRTTRPTTPLPPSSSLEDNAGDNRAVGERNRPNYHSSAFAVELGTRWLCSSVRFS